MSKLTQWKIKSIDIQRVALALNTVFLRGKN